MASEGERAEVANQGRNLLVAVADLTLTQLGIPGALACCGYLAGWWQSRTGQNSGDPERS